MPKLKALRGSIGSYGRVTAGGIIEVDEAAADKLLKTKRFTRATDQDVAAAEAAQKAYLKLAVAGAAPAFAPVPARPTPIEDEFAALELDEQRQLLERAGIHLRAEEARVADLTAELIKREEAVAAREEAVEAGEVDLADRLKAAAEQQERLSSWRSDLDARESALKEAAVAKEGETPAQPAEKATTKAEKAGK